MESDCDLIWLVGPPLVLGWRTKCLFWLFACCSAPSDQAAMTYKTYQRLFIKGWTSKTWNSFVYFFSECFSYWLAVQGEIKFAKMKLFNRKTWTNFHGALEVQISHQLKKAKQSKEGYILLQWYSVNCWKKKVNWDLCVLKILLRCVQLSMKVSEINVSQDPGDKG